MDELSPGRVFRPKFLSQLLCCMIEAILSLKIFISLTILNILASGNCGLEVPHRTKGIVNEPEITGKPIRIKNRNFHETKNQKKKLIYYLVD